MGGVKNGSCEISDGIPCAWMSVYERLKAQDRLDCILEIKPASNWQNQTPRTIVQEEYATRPTDK